MARTHADDAGGLAGRVQRCCAIRAQTIDGRSLKPLLQKLNPIWWFQNDDEQHVSDAPWYHPEWPQWRRKFYWNFLRNPLQNFRCYVLGVADRNYTVAGRAPVMTVQRDDLAPPEHGFQWCVLKPGNVLLPFVSYAGRRIVWYLGNQAASSGSSSASSIDTARPNAPARPPPGSHPTNA